MLLTTIDIRTGNEMTAFEVDPDNLPRPGDAIDIEEGVTWIVVGVVWKGHLDRLRPSAIRLLPLDTLKGIAAVGKQMGEQMSRTFAAGIAALGPLLDVARQQEEAGIMDVWK